MGDLSKRPDSRIDGWKSIARYVGRDRSTAMRWAAMRGLPVHRLPGGKRASVYALGHELDQWMAGERELVGAPQVSLNRRAVVAGALAAATAGSIFVVGKYRAKAEVPRAALELMEQARLLRSQHTRETLYQAIGMFREAVRLAPSHANAWGLLGHACGITSQWRKQAESELLRDQATMAGQRALDLDPRCASGELALAAALPLRGTGDWLARDNAMRRALAAEPDNQDALTDRAYVLRFTGHAAEVASLCERMDATLRTPVEFNIWIRALWSAGRIEEAERAIGTAFTLFPGNRTLWLTRLEVLIFTGREELAIRAARSDDRPTSIAQQQIDDLVALAESVKRRDPLRSEAAMQQQLQNARLGVRNAINAIRFASGVGRLDDAFAIAQAYFFARGFTVADDAGVGLYVTLEQRHTNFLFEPPAAPMWADPRFSQLTAELGLERYWRQARKPPDYRSSNRA